MRGKLIVAICFNFIGVYNWTSVLSKIWVLKYLRLLRWRIKWWIIFQCIFMYRSNCIFKSAGLILSWIWDCKNTLLNKTCVFRGMCFDNVFTELSHRCLCKTLMHMSNYWTELDVKSVYTPYCFFCLLESLCKYT